MCLPLLLPEKFSAGECPDVEPAFPKRPPKWEASQTGRQAVDEFSRLAKKDRNPQDRLDQQPVSKISVFCLGDKRLAFRFVFLTPTRFGKLHTCGLAVPHVHRNFRGSGKSPPVFGPFS
jgi:hypothetical protein